MYTYIYIYYWYVLIYIYKPMNSAVYSHDGSMVVTASYDTTANIYNTSTGECTMTLRGHTDNLCSAVFSHGGDVLTASEDCTAKLWKTANTSNED